MHRTITGLTAALAIAGCHGGRQKAADVAQSPLGPRREILKDVPYLSVSRLNDTTGTPEAEQRAYGTLISLDSVQVFYRDTLPKLGWLIQSDQPGALEATMYATKDSSALWIRIWRDPPGVRYTLIGTAIRKDTRPDSVRGAIRPPRHNPGS